jgi:P2-related tail formation protein
MACLLTTGRNLNNKNRVGGLKAVYFADFGTLGAVTQVAGEITVLAGTPDWFQYDLKGNSSLEQTITTSRENGSTFYNQTLNLTLPVLDKATQEEIKILSVNRPHVAIEDYNGNYFLVGLQHGADVTGGTIVTGAAMGDLSGFTLTLEAQEIAPAQFVLASVITAQASAVKIDPTAAC